MIRIFIVRLCTPLFKSNILNVCCVFMCQGITVPWIENISWKSFLTLTIPVCQYTGIYLHIPIMFTTNITSTLVNFPFPSPKWYHCHNCWGWDAPIFCTFLEPPVLLPSLARADPLGQRLGEVHLVLWRLRMAERFKNPFREILQ